VAAVKGKHYPRQEIDKEWLIEHYINQELSISLCGKLHNCSGTTIHKNLRKYGIPRRSVTQKAHEMVRKRIEQGIFALQLRDSTGENNNAKRPEVREKIRLGKLREKNPMWKGGITADNHDLRTNDDYQKWRSLVFKRDNYTCIKCDKERTYLEAHHQYNFSDHEDIRLNLANGITLCEDCHSDFHHIYGTRNNSPMQIMLFLLDS
jgi:hypothetical protein